MNKPHITRKEKYRAYKFLKLRATTSGFKSMQYLLGEFDGKHDRLEEVCYWLWYYHQVRFI